MQRAQICRKRVDVGTGDMCLTRGEQSPREQLIDGENHGICAAHILCEPLAHRVRISPLRVVVHILRRRRYDIATDDPAAVYDELPARRA